ncbi:MAG: type II toxin-antitoxin system HicB family antitoxin [Chloroflexi bacterium]|nr:type II toxin-antitoxin system HicB family antitoxin [Chloroflexota bacterium]
MAKYCFVIEKSENGYSAYVPDLPGCIAAGDTREETEGLIRQGIVYYLQSLQEHGEPLPESQASTGLVEV